MVDLSKTWSGSGRWAGVEMDYLLPSVESVQRAQEEHSDDGQKAAERVLVDCVLDVRGLGRRGEALAFPCDGEVEARRSFLRALPVPLYMRLAQVVSDEAAVDEEEE